jgi:uncharacterized protein YndB with AHSA1/START domain
MPDIVKAGTEVSFERIFDAPRDLVFRCWTEAKHLQAWWGPAGSENEDTVSEHIRLSSVRLALEWQQHPAA